MEIKEVYDTYRKHLHIENTHLIDVSLATYVTKDLPGKPLWMIPVGPSSYGKSTITSFLPYLEEQTDNDTKYRVLSMDQANAKAFASGSPIKRKNDIGTWLQNNKSIIYFSDMASLLVSEDAKKLFAMFRTLYDGTIKLATGVDKPDYKNCYVNMLGFSTPAIYSDIEHMSSMGTRELMYRLPRLMEPEKMLTKTPERGLKEIHQTVKKFIDERDEKPKTIQPDTLKYLDDVAYLMVILRAQANVTESGHLLEPVEKEIPKRLYDQLVKLWTGMEMVGVSEEQMRTVISDIQYGTGSRTRWKILERFFEDMDDEERTFLNFKKPRLCGIPDAQEELHSNPDEDGVYDVDRFTSIRKFANQQFLDLKTVTKEFLTLAGLGLIEARPEFPKPIHKTNAYDPDLPDLEYPEDHWHPYEENTRWFARPGATLRKREVLYSTSTAPSYFE